MLKDGALLPARRDVAVSFMVVTKNSVANTKERKSGGCQTGWEVGMVSSTSSHWKCGRAESSAGGILYSKESTLHCVIQSITFQNFDV